MAGVKEIATGFFSANKKIFVIIIILLAAIVAGIIVFKIRRALKKPVNATYVEGGGPVPTGWDPTAMTKELFDVIDGTLVSTNRMQQVFGKFNDLNDNQMIAVYNKWNDLKYPEEKKYYITPYGSLTAAIKDKIGYLGFDDNEKEIAERNLDRLRLA